MPLPMKARSFLRNLFLSRRVDVDLDREVRAHLEMLTEENLRAGMLPNEAQRAARIELGGIEQVKDAGTVFDNSVRILASRLLRCLRWR